MSQRPATRTVIEMCVVEKDFDRLALLDDEGWTANNHYHNFLLRRVPERCENALEIGCGTGAFARLLASRAANVVALDLSPEMIRVARSRANQIANVEFHVADVMRWDFPAEHFDYVATIATLHHVPSDAVLRRIKSALKPGGVLVVMDLLEPERGLLELAGLRDMALNGIALGVSCTLQLAHNGRLRPPREVRAAWDEHGKRDTYLTISEVAAVCADLFPCAQITRHLLWRYSIVWRKPWQDH